MPKINKQHLKAQEFSIFIGEIGRDDELERYETRWYTNHDEENGGGRTKTQTMEMRTKLLRWSWVVPVLNQSFLFATAGEMGPYGYFRLIRAQTGRFDLRYDSQVWFGGMIRGMIRGYDSRVWIAARKTFISSIGRELSLEPKLYRPVHYQLN